MNQNKENFINYTPSFVDLPLDLNDLNEENNDVHYDNVADALVYCLSTYGKVDIKYISQITKCNYKTVIMELKGAIYQNPETWNEFYDQGWETSDEYLSGNIMRKYRAAIAANKKYKGYFNDNIIALQKLLPKSISNEDIYVTLGSPWVPTHVIDDFIYYLFGDPFRGRKHWYTDYLKNSSIEHWKTLHDEIIGTWEIPDKGRYEHSVAVSKTYGTQRIEGLYILEKTLNLKSITIYDEITSPNDSSKTIRIVNQEETLAAIEKQKKMLNIFQKWIWADEKRKDELLTIFENKFGCIKKRIFDGSFLKFPGMSPSIKLYPYQKNAIARIILTPNTLLAHDVGAGKTYIMIAAGMELKRMGLSSKNMYVVPNNIVGQWESIFLSMYPNAKILSINPKTFKTDKRQNVLKDIMDNYYDAIIIAYSCFNLIPISKEYHIEQLKAKIAKIDKIQEEKKKVTSSLIQTKRWAEKSLEELTNKNSKEKYITFDDLNITRLFVDEAHNFKNVPLNTGIINVLGINSAGSKKCKEMMDKVHMIQQKNNGAGAIFATGTPITNSITDAYIMQQYLQNGELTLLGLQNFDSWLGMFAEQRTEFEIDVDTNSYRLASRFSQFHNLPELTSLFASVADFHSIDNSIDLPDFNSYTDVLIPKTNEFNVYLGNISKRADDIRHRRVKPTEDNLLKITTDGRKAALDLRLVVNNSNFTINSKVAKCAENIAKIYHKTEKDKSTQLVFCDSSTPKNGFNLYDELKYRLELLNVKKEEIDYIHNATTEKKKAKLFAKMQKGEIRILIGSTFKLGLGVNIQNKLIALHHLDIPWRPADMVQREGRIIRQGNENKEIQIFRYITEGSFDAYSWQLLETKQRFIVDLLSGSVTERDGSDIDNTVLDYAEVKALAIGNPLIKERVELVNELNKLKLLQKKQNETKIKLRNELLELPKLQAIQNDLIEKCQKDIDSYEQYNQDHPMPIHNKEKKERDEKRKEIRAIINQAIKNYTPQNHEVTILNYKGFDIVLPTDLSIRKPYIYLKQNGCYSLEIGDDETRNLVRIDNFLKNLELYCNKLESTLLELNNREKAINNELLKDDNYNDQMNKLSQQIKQINKKLGVGE